MVFAPVFIEMSLFDVIIVLLPDEKDVLRLDEISVLFLEKIVVFALDEIVVFVLDDMVVIVSDDMVVALDTITLVVPLMVNIPLVVSARRLIGAVAVFTFTFPL
jgi:hypothetical protein